jgi:predicted nucleic acid-binding protein
VTVVLDASVVIKWLLAEQDPDTERATQLMEAVASGALATVQPVH